MMGFIRGKFYNRCTRIHQLLANVLEQKLYNRFLEDLDLEALELLQQVIETVLLDPLQTDTPLCTGCYKPHQAV